MPFVPASGVARVEMLYSLNGEIVQNVYHVADWPGTISGTELQALIDVFQAWETNTARNNRSVECALTEIRATDLTSIGGVQVVEAMVPPIAGTATGDAMPGNVTYAVKLATTRGPRGTQGRTFWIGLAEQMTDGNLILQVTSTGIVNALETLRQTLIASSTLGVLAVLHSMENGIPMSPREATPVNQIVARDLVLDSQKSRLPGKRRKSRAQNT